MRCELIVKFFNQLLIPFFVQLQRCMGKFECRRDLQQHLRSVHSFCTICNTKCRNQTTLQGHILRKHTKHVCDKCGKVLGSLSSHRAHQATHGLHLKFTCPYCQKGFLAKSLLDHHIVIHTKESNFQCHVCGQNFVHQRALRLHIQWHTNPRPYKCPFCEKTYKHISHLAVHKRAVHLGELPNACQVCEKRFATASKLKVHMVKHTGVYSHPCKLCSRGYMKRYKWEPIWCNRLCFELIFDSFHSTDWPNTWLTLMVTIRCWSINRNANINWSSGQHGLSLNRTIWINDLHIKINEEISPKKFKRFVFIRSKSAVTYSAYHSLFWHFSCHRQCYINKTVEHKVSQHSAHHISKHGISFTSSINWLPRPFDASHG